MPDDLQILHEAIARGTPAVALFHGPDGQIPHKSRFLSKDEDGFWIDGSDCDASIVEPLIGTELAIGIAFKSGLLKTVFTTHVLKRVTDFAAPDQSTTNAILLAYPPQVQIIQRRAHYRASVDEGSGLPVKIWRIPDHAILRDKPSASVLVTAAIRDISIAGMGIYCSPPIGRPQLAQGERLRIVLPVNGEDLLIDGRAIRVIPQADGSARAGIQFRKLETDFGGRQTLAALTALVGNLSRHEIRRTRGPEAA